MANGDLPEGIQGILVKRLRAIPDGQITAVSKRAGISLTAILRLRRGEATDIRLATLERLAKGLQISASDLIAGEPGTELPRQAQRGVDPRMVRSLIRKARAFVGDVEKYARSVAEEEEADSAPADPARRGNHGKK